MNDSYQIFISYRRESGEQYAKLLYDLFSRDGYSVFFDQKSNTSGEMKDILEKSISNSDYFFWIITEGCFKDIDFNNPPDYNNLQEKKPGENYRREITYALKNKDFNRIIPILTTDERDFLKIPILTGREPKYEKFPDNLGGLIDFYNKIKQKIYVQCVKATVDLDCTIYEKIGTVRANNPTRIPLSKGEHNLAFVSKEQSSSIKEEIIHVEDKSIEINIDLIPEEQYRIADENKGILEIPVKGKYFKTSFNMIFVEGGTYLMGQGKDEKTNKVGPPPHEESVKSFWIAETVVTQKLYRAVMGHLPEKGSDAKSYVEGDDYPVVFVSWDDAKEFIDELNDQTNEQFRLPTSAEWEWAARGGKASHGYPYSGSDKIDDVAWYKGNSKKHIHEVKVKEEEEKKEKEKWKRENELNIFGMSGNVYEWCEDASNWAESHITRGGSCDQGEIQCRVSYCSDAEASRRGDNLGFRIATTRLTPKKYTSPSQ